MNGVLRRYRPTVTIDKISYKISMIASYITVNVYTKHDADKNGRVCINLRFRSDVFSNHSMPPLFTVLFTASYSPMQLVKFSLNDGGRYHF